MAVASEDQDWVILARDKKSPAKGQSHLPIFPIAPAIGNFVPTLMREKSRAPTPASRPKVPRLEVRDTTGAFPGSSCRWLTPGDTTIWG
jgi:hypothetical protein